MKLTFAIACLLTSAALAQAQPDDEWGGFPGQRPAVVNPGGANTSGVDAGVADPAANWPAAFNAPPASKPAVVPPDFNPPPASRPPPVLPPPLVSPEASSPPATTARAWEPITTRIRPPDPPNTVSMNGGMPLGQWKRGQSINFGFPLISIRLAIGLTSRLDAGVGFDSFYGVMNEPRLTVRYALVTSSSWNLAASVEGGPAFFNVRANKEVNGPRWITGRRNGNLAPGLMASYQGTHPRAARLYLDLRYMMTFDTEPFAKNPLSGVPPNFVLGHNVLANLGAEIPLTDKTSFAFRLGLDFHLRAEDAPVMPVAMVGLVTSI